MAKKPKNDQLAREIFLRELTQLSLRHGFVIGGCGCCGSPYVTNNKNHVKSGDELKWS